jgi:hypothetical protein
MSGTVLEAEESQYLEAQRGWLKAHFPDNPEGRYATVEGKMDLIERILANGWITEGETRQYQALGVGFGDSLAQELGFVWVTVQDEHGRDPALNWPGTSLLCFPATMISSRIEDGEKVDVRQLFAGMCETLNDAKSRAGAVAG